MIINYGSCVTNFFKLEHGGSVITVDVTDYEYTWNNETGVLILTKYIGSDLDIITPTETTQFCTLTVTANPNTALINVRFGVAGSVSGVGTLVVNNLQYGSVASVTVSDNGYDPKTIPVIVDELNMSLSVTLTTNIDLGTLNEDVSIYYDFGLTSGDLTDTNIDCGTL